MVVDAVKDSITHLPQTAAAAATKVGDVFGSAAREVGEVASEVGKGLFSGLRTPLLIGAGLVGVVLISRGRRASPEV